jgi:hypothetical protein
LLTTNNSRRLETVPPLSESDFTTWRAVNLELWIPYAFITHSTKEETLWLSQTTIFWIEDDILDFCRAFRGNRMRKIVDFSLLLPNDNEKSSFQRRWVQIRELWSRKAPASAETYLVYISMEKERIGETEHVSDVTREENVELLYRSKTR